MIVAWIIGLILSLWGIYLFKGSRIKASNGWCKPAKPERPVLRVWSAILYFMGAIIPIFNIIMALVMIIWWGIAVYGDEDWKYTRSAWFISLLNKPIK